MTKIENPSRPNINRSFLLERLGENRINMANFLEAFSINLEPKTLDVCRIGYDIMRKSEDRSHTHRHIDRLMHQLALYLLANPDKLQSLDFEVLLPALHLHDIYKALFYDPKVTTIKYIKQNLIEGVESAKLAYRLMTEMNLPKKQILKVAWAILNHADFHLPRFGKETKTLVDLDMADAVAADRLPEYQEQLNSATGVDPNSFWTVKTINHYINFYKNHKYFDVYFQRQAGKRVPVFEQGVRAILADAQSRR